jgi:hypothetical protein
VRFQTLARPHRRPPPPQEAPPNPTGVFPRRGFHQSGWGNPAFRRPFLLLPKEAAHHRPDLAQGLLQWPRPLQARPRPQLHNQLRRVQPGNRAMGGRAQRAHSGGQA